MNPGSTLTLNGSGTMSGEVYISNGPGITINTGGILNAVLLIWSGSQTLPARVYGGMVQVGNYFSGTTASQTVTLGPGVFTFNGGLPLEGDGPVSVLDATVNNPTVNFSTLTPT